MPAPPALLAQQDVDATAFEPAALAVVDLWKKYGTNQALSGTSFSIKQGERLALLGPNAAGKTTLIRSMCGRVRPDRGQVLLHGRSIREHDVLQRMGVVPQDLAIYSDLTAKQNLECFGQLHGLELPLGEQLLSVPVERQFVLPEGLPVGRRVR